MGRGLQLIRSLTALLESESNMVNQTYLEKNPKTRERHFFPTSCFITAFRFRASKSPRRRRTAPPAAAPGLRPGSHLARPALRTYRSAAASAAHASAQPLLQRPAAQRIPAGTSAPALFYQWWPVSEDDVPFIKKRNKNKTNLHVRLGAWHPRPSAPALREAVSSRKEAPEQPRARRRQLPACGTRPTAVW